MKKQTRFTTEKTPSLQQPRNGHKPELLPRLRKKHPHTSPTERILRDLLNTHPVHDEGSCWPIPTIGKK